MMEENICGARDRIKGEEEEAIVLPGFRFHPTDEELVGFYLLGKVEGKCINTRLITQLDIYKYDPWDLPEASSSTGEKEWYFYCRRGRKYPNSVRPNRVTLTGSGFWKATGIDKPIHSSNCSNKCIGLKKSLVYYRGNAGKGMKTDWMMHEFRLPSGQSDISNQEAEVWTLCRIFQRNNASHKKSKPDWKHTTNNKISVGHANSTKCSGFEYVGIRNGEHHIAFQGEEVIRSNRQEIRSQDFLNIPDEIPMAPSPMASSSSSLWTANGDNIFRKGGWDELGSVIGLAVDRSL